jgi:hypothetical protein
LVKISWTIPAAATSLTAAPQLDLRAPRLGVGLGTVSATLTSGGNPVAGQQITFTADAPLRRAPPAERTAPAFATGNGAPEVIEREPCRGRDSILGDGIGASKAVACSS